MVDNKSKTTLIRHVQKKYITYEDKSEKLSKTSSNSEYKNFNL